MRYSVSCRPPNVKQKEVPFLLMVLLFLFLAGITDCFAEGKDAGKPEAADLTDMSLESLMQLEVATVYGASRFEQKETEAPASVSIITADEIKKYGYRTLADILRSVSGLFVSNDRTYEYLGIGGFHRPGDYNTRFLLLVDGHRINDNIYDQVPIGTDFPIDIDLIDRIELIRGSTFTLYGSNAFFATGVINVITRHGRDIDGAEVSGSGGSNDTYTGRFTYGRKLRNGIDVLLSGSAYDSNGNHRLYYPEFDDPATNHGIAENMDGDSAHGFFGRIAYRDLTLEGVWHTRNKITPTASFDTIFNDPRNDNIDERAYVDLQYRHAFGDSTDVLARLFYDEYTYRGDFPLAAAGQTSVVNRDDDRGRWLGGEIVLTRELFRRHKLTVGTEYQYNLTQELMNFDVDPYRETCNVRKHSDRIGFFAQDEIHLLYNLILNVGVRYDYYSTFGDTVNPRVALIYNPLETTSIKLLYGEGFRAPNVYENFYTGAGDFKANPDLEPETIRNLELVYEQYYGRNFRSSVSGFYYHISDLISQQKDPVDNLLVFRNLGSIHGLGAELEVQGSWSNGMNGRLSYTYQDVTDDDTGSHLTDAPMHLAKLNLTVPLLADKLFAGVEGQYTASRKTLDGGRTGGFFVTNLTLFSQNILKNLELSASVYNLFDRRFADPASVEHRQNVIEQDGRTFRVKLVYCF